MMLLFRRNDLIFFHTHSSDDINNHDAWKWKFERVLDTTSVYSDAGYDQYDVFICRKIS